VHNFLKIDPRVSELADPEIWHLAFATDFAGRPYNTLSLPCERVIAAEQLFSPVN